MQRASSFPRWLAALIYLAVVCLANGCAHADEPVEPSAPATAPPAAAPAKHPPHIAAILPLKSTSLGRLADAVRLGILEAARASQSDALPLIIHATADDPADVANVYQQAVRDGARLVIGPLTRSAVSLLATSNLVVVPTLALNAPEGEPVVPLNLHLFGLQIESEAKQAAHLATLHGKRKALIVLASDTALSRRLAQAFEEELSARNGQVIERIGFTQDAAVLIKLREQIVASGADMIFLALDAERARRVRSYLGSAVPIYATSLVYSSTAPLAGFELNGVYFVDMPWLLTPDHPAVISYAQPDASIATLELKRFYALGIDAYRIALELLKPQPDFATLDGVTGALVPERDHRWLRQAMPAQFNQGEAKPLSESAPSP